MNILFLTLVEFNSINDRGIYSDLMREFIKNNHHVYIISPIERRNKQETHIIETENCRILKVKIGNIQKTNIIEKGISTLFIESKLKRAINRYFNNIKFDLILYSTPPITFVDVVKKMKEKYNAMAYLMLKDIFPQNAVDLQMFSNKSIVYRFFRKKEKELYKISDYIGCMSQANINFVLEHNKEIDVEKVEVCPNSIEPVNLEQIEKKDIRQIYSIPSEAVVFIYGGNLGKPQCVNFIIEALKCNINLNDRYFVICGNGTDYYKIEKYIAEAKPQNIRLLKGLPKQEYNKLLECCDVGLLFLDKRFTIPNFPSRLLSYMEYSMPIVACTDVNTDVGQVIEQGEFGLWCESSDTAELKKLIDTVCTLERSELELMGKNARTFLENNYKVENSYKIIIKHFEQET